MEKYTGRCPKCGNKYDEECVGGFDVDGKQICVYFECYNCRELYEFNFIPETNKNEGRS